MRTVNVAVSSSREHVHLVVSRCSYAAAVCSHAVASGCSHAIAVLYSAWCRTNNGPSMQYQLDEKIDVVNLVDIGGQGNSEFVMRLEVSTSSQCGLRHLCVTHQHWFNPHRSCCGTASTHTQYHVYACRRQIYPTRSTTLILTVLRYTTVSDGAKYLVLIINCPSHTYPIALLPVLAC